MIYFLINFYKGNTTKTVMLGKGGSGGRENILSYMIIILLFVLVNIWTPYYNARVELHQRVVNLTSG